MFWPIGLLVLAIIPLVFYWHIANDPIYHTKYTMEINMPPSGDYFKIQKRIYPNLDVPPSGNWKIFSFSGDVASNELRLAELQQEVKRFMKQGDTIQGIQIILSRQMTYNMFVKTIDMLNLENVTQYSIWNSNVWIHKFPRTTRQVDEYPMTICGGVHFTNYNLPLTWFQRVKQAIQEYYFYFHNAVQQLPLSVILVWFLLFALNIYQIKINGLPPNHALKLTE
jgi:hypothetical protein